MKIELASHYGMCFGVRDALAATHELAEERPLTILGELVHNPVVMNRLRDAGAKEGELRGQTAPTDDVVITAHGAADRDRKIWAERGHQVTDTTCPLVHKAHRALANLVESGYFPVVIGRKGHVEVQGLTGDFPETVVIGSSEEIELIPHAWRIGVISQTTQPIAKVEQIVEEIKAARSESEVRFVDTVCKPTKNRQLAIEELAAGNEVVVVVGGANSNNTAMLAKTAERFGARAHHIQQANQVDPKWFLGIERVGVTAGTSTPPDTIEAVVARLHEIAGTLPASTAEAA